MKIKKLWTKGKKLAKEIDDFNTKREQRRLKKLQLQKKKLSLQSSIEKSKADIRKFQKKDKSNKGFMDDYAGGFSQPGFVNPFAPPKKKR